MTKPIRIKLRLSITLSTADLGLRRIYNEMLAIENDTSLSEDAKSDAKRNHLLGILYQYSYATMAPFLTSAPVAQANSPVVTPTITFDKSASSSSHGSLLPNVSVTAEPVVDKSPAVAELNVLAGQGLADNGLVFTAANPSS